MKGCDPTTDAPAHTALVKGRTGKGTGAVYAFQDPWPTKEAEAQGEFKREDDGRLVYSADDKGEKLATRYVVAMVRINKVG